MVTNGRNRTLGSAALFILGFSIATAQAEQATVAKRGAFPELGAPRSNKPGMTAADQEKLKKDLSSAREKAKGSAAPARVKKP